MLDIISLLKCSNIQNKTIYVKHLNNWVLFSLFYGSITHLTKVYYFLYRTKYLITQTRTLIVNLCKLNLNIDIKIKRYNFYLYKLFMTNLA